MDLAQAKKSPLERPKLRARWAGLLQRAKPSVTASLTKLGWLLLGGIVLLYFAALTSQSGLLLLFVGALLGCGLVNLVAAWRAVGPLEIYPPPSVQLCEGEPMTQAWRVVNRGRRAAGFVEASSSAGVLFRLGVLGAGAETSVVPDLVFWKRGVFPNAAVRVVSRHPFGLIKASRPLPLPGEVVVGPAVYPAPTPRAAGYDVMLGGKFKGHRRCTSGAAFAGVRPFQEGDPLKQVHWKSSAKGLGLMVKTFDEELSGRVACILDCSAAGQGRRLDDCVRAAGSLLFAALDAGHHVEWIDLHRLEPRLVPPFADGQEILDGLARVESAPGTLTEERLRQAVERVSRRSALCLVLTEFNPAVATVLEHLQQHRRLVSAYLPADEAVPAAHLGVPVFKYSEKKIVAG